MKKQLGQKDRLLEWFKSGGRVNRMSALIDFGIFELSARIIDLEMMGHTIQRRGIRVKTRFSGTVPCKEYWMEM